MRVAIRRSLFAVGSIVASLSVASTAFSQQASPATAGSTKQMQPADLKEWKTIRSSVLSSDGKWFAYVLAPNEGDASVVIRSTGTDNKEWTFPVGSSDAAGRGGGGGRGGAPGDATAGPLSISPDSRWAAFMVYPPSTNGRAGRAGGAGRGGRGGGAPTTQEATQAAPASNKLALVNLSTGEKKEFDRVRRYAFNGDKPNWLAIQAPPDAGAAATGNAAGGARGGAAPAGGNAPATPRVEGTDLLLYNLSNGEAVNVGNVAEFGFDDTGDWLAYTIDARDEIGNGVQLRNMRTDVVRAIDSDRSLYRHLVWADSVDALAVLRGRVDSTARDTVFSVVTFTQVAASTPKKTVFDAAQHSEFPSGMAISVDRAPRLAEDLSAVFFGIREAKKPDRTLAGRGSSVIQAGAPGMGGTINQPRVNEAQEENPSLILWNVKDPRLQSQQIVQEAQDRQFNFLSEYRLADNKFVRLADEQLRNVTVAPHDHFATGTDTRDYEQPAAYTGRQYEDDYIVDLSTGKRSLVLKKHRPAVRTASPNGKEELYWGDDGNYWVLDLATGAKRNITKATGVNFSNTDDDHNYLVPPARPPFGWTKDGTAVLLTDGWDIWKVPTAGTGSALNLTVNGKRDQIRYNRVYSFDRGGAGAAGGRGGGRGGRGGGASPGIDLSQPLYVGSYGEWTKKAGLSRVDPNAPGAKSLVWDDASFDFQKARDADTYVYTKQSARDFPNYYVANADFKGGRQLTDANPQQKDFAWTSGVRLINYTSAKGDKLQGALYLPANYEPGKKYPLLVTIYEKRSNLANTYVGPSETSTPNRSMYTSRGYAVLDPDIVYRINDPGMSAVWCVVPAVKAAIATGMIDSSEVGLWGHSWGGYQTAFLVTQTNIFKAAIAGAPLTNMVSMYASVYWNTGNSDASIFEDSQGRFKGNVAQNYDAYVRNSPVFHADKVKTPLIILADDKDGAVDFNQGITYYNTLAQMNKDVILLEYVGENHGLARPINQKDYAMRQKDWFDHYLKGAPAPDWMTKGIPRIKMDEYWQSLKAQQTGSIVP